MVPIERNKMRVSTAFLSVLIIVTMLNFVISLKPALTCESVTSNNYDLTESPNMSSTQINFGYRIMSLEQISIISHVSYRIIPYNVSTAFYNQSFSLQLRMNFEWTDDRLSNVKNLVPYINRSLDSNLHNCFWKPKFKMITLKSSRILQDDLHRIVFIVDRNPGRLLWIQTYDLVVHCEMDIAWYPMDTQKCSVTFITCKSIQFCHVVYQEFTGETDHVRFSWIPVKGYHEPRTESSYNFKTKIKEIKCFTDRQATCHELSFEFKRRFKLYLMTVYFPSCLIVLTSFVSFWIDPTAVPARVTLSVTSLLALMTQMISVRSSIPNVNYVTAIDIWFLVCTTFVSLSMFEYALIHTVIKKSAVPSQIPTYIRPFSTLRHEKEKKRSNCNIDSSSKVLFPLLFTFYILAYTVMFLYFPRK